jgi:hypothetical protein
MVSSYACTLWSASILQLQEWQSSKASQDEFGCKAPYLPEFSAGEYMINGGILLQDVLRMADWLCV